MYILSTPWLTRAQQTHTNTISSLGVLHEFVLYTTACTISPYFYFFFESIPYTKVHTILFSQLILACYIILIFLFTQHKALNQYQNSNQSQHLNLRSWFHDLYHVRKSTEENDHHVLELNQSDTHHTWSFSYMTVYSYNLINIWTLLDSWCSIPFWL